jgi:tetratricopeptide (TPR) repeat protein
VALEQVLRARHCLSLDRLEEAEALAREAARDAASAPEALHLLGLALYRRGRLDEAEAALRRALERDANVAAFHHDLGNVLQERGKHADAVRAYRRALRLQPQLAEAWNDLGTARYARGELEAAVECYQHAVRLRGDHAVAHANLGAVYRKIGLLREARRALQRELVLRAKAALLRPFGRRRLDLASPAMLAGLAQRQLEAGNARHAAAIARRALELAPRDPGALCVLSGASLSLGQIDEALEAAEAADSAPHLARALQRAGRIDEAVAQYERILRDTPRDAEAPAELAALLVQRREWARAEQVVRRALQRQPGRPDLHLLLGEARHRQKALDEAEAAYRRALELDAQLIAAQVRLSDVLRDSGRLDEALAAARRAVELDDESPLGHFALAMALRAKGRMDAALQSFETARARDPERAQTLQQLALALREMDRLEEALAPMRAAARLRPGDARLLSDLGMLLADTMRYDEARECYRRALDMAPDDPDTIQRLGLLVDHLGDAAQGEALLLRAKALAPQDDHVHYNLGLHRLKHGRFAEGWEGYERRRRFDSFIGRFRDLPLPEWEGSPLGERTVLVMPEQGLGDEIMFGSCVPEIVERAGHVYLECDPKLEALFRRSFPSCSVVSRQRTLANDWVNRLEPRPEVQISAGSLALRFRRSPADFPGTPFLEADAQSVAAWRAKLEKLGPGAKIGLSWRGGVGYTGKTRRSVPLERLLPVLRLPGMQFVNLQYTDARQEMRELEARHSIRIHHWQEAIDDYDQTAALVSALDGVLTVCTAIVHLSGALGQRALVMVPFGADWRYGGAGERMPRYGSVRLLRQQRVGDWSDVLREVSGRLAAGAWQ